MTAFTATRAGLTKPAASVGWAQDTKTGWGTIEVSAAAPADVFNMVRIPKGAMIVGGRVLGDKLDSTGAGSACMTVNIGLTAAVLTPAGVSVSTASTSNALGAAWAFGSDFSAVLGYKPETGRNLPLGGLLLSDGPLFVQDECWATLTVITSAGGLTTGSLTLQVDYYMAQHS